MRRSFYFNYIESRLSNLVASIEIRSKLNILDLHIHSENFYLNFFNKVFGWNLTNLNSTSQNVEAIDLLDLDKKIVIQVTATATKQKIESALGKDLSAYSDFNFKFIFISKDASELRDKTYKNPHKLTFVPSSDIYDVPRILKFIMPLEAEVIRPIYNFIKSELGDVPDPVKLESNLASIINLIAREDLNNPSLDIQVNAFEVDKKITFNNLELSSSIINDYSINQNQVDKIYSEFNKQGQNKSLSVLQAIRQIYLKNKSTISEDVLFFKIIEEVTELILNSKNYSPIPAEELDLCVNILVVDAFIRCKIFENPMNYSYATA